jgi:PAS domain S-box-containing protein
MTPVALESLMCRRDNLEHVLDSLKEGIIAHDAERRIFFFNREAERITGFPREEVLGRDCHEAFGAPFCGGHCAFCDDPPEVAETADYTLNITTKSGEPRRIEMRVTRMQDEGGGLIGILSSF